MQQKTLPEQLSEAIRMPAGSAKMAEVSAVLEKIKQHHAVIAGIERVRKAKPHLPQVDAGQMVEIYPACITAIEQGDFTCFNLLFPQVTLTKAITIALLCAAAEQDNSRVLDHLLTCPQFIGNYDDQVAAIFRAIQKDRVQNVQKLLSRGLTAHMQEHKINLLSELTKHPAPNCLEYLLTLNPTREALGELLLAAAANGRLDIVQKLIEDRRIDVDYRTPKPYVGSRDRYDVTALMATCAAGHVEVARYLISQRADVNARNSKGANALLMICSDISHQASEDKYLDCAKLLLAHRADAEVVDKYGKNGIHYIYDKNKPKLLALLLRSGLDPNTTIEQGQGYSVLRHVIEIPCIPSVRVLLDYGANPDIDLGKWNAWLRHKDIIMLLVLAGCDLTQLYNDYFSSLRHAVLVGCSHSYTPHERNLIETSVKLKVLSEALAQGNLAAAVGLVDDIFNAAPALFVGYFRLLSARQIAKESPRLFWDPRYHLVILRILKLAKAKDVSLYQQLTLIIGQDFYRGYRWLAQNHKNLLSLLFLMEGKDHEKFADYPTAQMAGELIIGEGALPHDEQSLRARFPQQYDRLSQVLSNFREVYFSDIYYSEIEGGKRIPVIYNSSTPYIRNGDQALQAESINTTHFAFFLNNDGTFHSIHTNPASHALWKKLLTFKESGGLSQLFSNRTSFVREIPEIARRLLGIDFTPQNHATSEIDLLLAYIANIERVGDYQQQLASPISLPTIINEIKGYLEILKKQKQDELNPSSSEAEAHFGL